VKWNWFRIVTNANGGLLALVFVVLVLFLYLCLFNDTLSTSDYVASNIRVNNKLEKMWKKVMAA
jgi:hypothetical protein